MTEAHVRPTRDEYGLVLAGVVSSRADCRRKQVGCVLIGPDNRVISTGYNGAPAGEPGCLEGACPRGLLTYEELAENASYDEGPGRCISVHAEVNAVIYAGQSCKGATAFVTHTPCYTCEKVLAAAGIVRTVVLNGEEEVAAVLSAGVPPLL